MNYLKYTQYIYLIVAVLFIYDAVKEYVSENKIPYLSLLFATGAVAMFFFRRKMAKRIDSNQ